MFDLIAITIEGQMPIYEFGYIYRNYEITLIHTYTLHIES